MLTPAGVRCSAHGRGDDRVDRLAGWTATTVWRRGKAHRHRHPGVPGMISARSGRIEPSRPPPLCPRAGDINRDRAAITRSPLWRSTPRPPRRPRPRPSNARITASGSTPRAPAVPSMPAAEADQHRLHPDRASTGWLAGDHRRAARSRAHRRSPVPTRDGGGEGRSSANNRWAIPPIANPDRSRRRPSLAPLTAERPPWWPARRERADRPRPAVGCADRSRRSDDGCGGD